MEWIGTRLFRNAYSFRLNILWYVGLFESEMQKVQHCSEDRQQSDLVNVEFECKAVNLRHTIVMK